MPTELASGNRVAVLLANRNGERWLPEFLASLQGQTGVAVRLIASDNCSEDSSLAFLREFAQRFPTDILPPHAFLDCASKHFFRIIRDADVGDADYVALADNDDVWLPAKLESAIAALARNGAEVYSGQVTPFWVDGRKARYHQPTTQKRYDHYFQAGGAGCTIVMRRDFYEAFRDFLAHNDSVWSLFGHDWALYAFARSRGHRWFIDSASYLLYRQHGSNESGVSQGFRAALKRFRLVRNGWYYVQISTLAKLFPCEFPGAAIQRFNWFDRVNLAFHAYDLRRSARDAAALVPLLFALKK